MSKQTKGGPGDLLVRIGAAVFLLGAAGTLATVAPLLLGTDRLPTPAYFVSMLMGVGLAVALVGLLRAAMGQRSAIAGAGVVPGDAGTEGAGGTEAGATETGGAAQAAAEV